MNSPEFDKTDAGKWFAIEANNRAWELLERPERSEDKATEMLHAAHAACHHWTRVGTVTHHARAECLVALVNAELSLASSAVRSADRCLDLVEAHPDVMEDWDVAFAYDCAARARAAAGELNRARELQMQARSHGDQISGSEDKQVFDQWFAAGCWHGLED